MMRIVDNMTFLSRARTPVTRTTKASPRDQAHLDEAPRARRGLHGNPCPSKNKTAVGRHRFRVLSAANESAAQPERMRRFLNRGTLVVRVFRGNHRGL